MILIQFIFNLDVSQGYNKFAQSWKKIRVLKIEKLSSLLQHLC